ncbi:response regulator [Rhodohalobacter sp. 8-1]|uniref:response regulator n=1 Tax=Rhodohalobacter sp. 8-1 TaxID=3131972 RepID=UPI0030ED2435
MKKPTLLIVDDEPTIHIILKALLGKQYDLRFASDAQEAIDILAVESVYLLILDIQMPDLSGLELLESLMLDSAYREIPVIIFTGKVTEEREKKALMLGAATFISKDALLTDMGKENLQKHIRRHVGRTIISTPQKTDHRRKSIEIIKELVFDAGKNDFFFSARRLGANIKRHFGIDYISFWSIENERPNLLMYLGGRQPDDFGPDDIKTEHAYNVLTQEKKAYLTNNSGSGKSGIFSATAMAEGLSSEIGIPLFKITRKELTKNTMRIPEDTPVYGFVILKRQRVFTTKDFKIINKTVQYCGSLLWGLFQGLYVK